MVKGQGQTAGLWKKKCFPLTSFDLSLTNLVQWMPLGIRWPLKIFRLHDQMSRSNCWSLKKKVVHPIFLDRFAGKLPNLVQWILLEIRWLLSMFKSHSQRSRSNCWYKCCLLNIFLLLSLKVQVSSSYFYAPLWKKVAYCFALVGQSVCRSVCKPSDVRSIFFYHSARKLPNLVQRMPLESRCLVTFSKVKVKLLVFIVHVVYSIFYDPLMVTKLATHLLTLEIA